MTTPVGSELLGTTLVFQRAQSGQSIISAGSIRGVNTDEAQVPTVRVYAAAENETYQFELVDSATVFRVYNSGKEAVGSLEDYIVVN